MCGHSGDANPRAPHPVLGFAIDQEASPSSRVATGAGLGGCAIKGLVGLASIARRSPCSGEGGPLRHSDIIHVSVSNAYRGTTTPGRGNTAFLLARIGPSGD